MRTLRRRFKSFLGISERENRTIENGLTRLEIPDNLDAEKIEEVNHKMMKSASERDKLRKQWGEALKHGIHLVEEVKLPMKNEMEVKQKIHKKKYMAKSIQHVGGELGFGLLAFAHDLFGMLQDYQWLREGTVNNVADFIWLFGRN